MLKSIWAQLLFSSISESLRTSLLSLPERLDVLLKRNLHLSLFEKKSFLALFFDRLFLFVMKKAIGRPNQELPSNLLDPPRSISRKTRT